MIANVARIGDGLVYRVPFARTNVDSKFKVESMKKRTTENIEPKPRMNIERQTTDTTSRQTIFRTNVVSGSFSFFVCTEIIDCPLVF